MTEHLLAAGGADEVSFKVEEIAKEYTSNQANDMDLECMEFF